MNTKLLLESSLGEPETYYGGLVYRRGVDPVLAQEIGRRVQSLAGGCDDPFYPPISPMGRHVNPQPLVGIQKAWIHTEPENVKSPEIKVLSRNANHTQIDILRKLIDLSDDIDAMFGVTSVERFVQAYEPEALLPKHTDDGSWSRHITLIGGGLVRWHDRETDEIVERVPVSSGDIVWMDDQTPHSVSADASGRVSLGLVDVAA